MYITYAVNAGAARAPDALCRACCRLTRGQGPKKTHPILCQTATDVRKVNEAIDDETPQTYHLWPKIIRRVHWMHIPQIK